MKVTFNLNHSVEEEPQGEEAEQEGAAASRVINNIVLLLLGIGAGSVMRGLVSVW